MTNWSPSNINDPGFGAGLSTMFWWSCDGDPTNIHVDAIRMAVYFTGSAPMISGPDTVWWFNGATPPNYPTQITLHSDAGANTSWSVTAGSQRVALLVGGTPCSNSCVGSDLQVVPSGNAISLAPDDISITATEGGVSSSPFTLSVRMPWKLVPVQPGYSETDPGAPGYEHYDTYLHYWVYDNLDDRLPQDIDWAETVGDPQSLNGSNWDQLNVGGTSTFFGVLIDHLSPPYGAGIHPTAVYTTSNPPDGTVYMSASQDIRVGARDTSPQGAWVQSDDLTFYIDHGAHKTIITH